VPPPRPPLTAPLGVTTGDGVLAGEGVAGLPMVTDRWPDCPAHAKVSWYWAPTLASVSTTTVAEPLAGMVVRSKMPDVTVVVRGQSEVTFSVPPGRTVPGVALNPKEVMSLWAIATGAERPRAAMPRSATEAARVERMSKFLLRRHTAAGAAPALRDGWTTDRHERRYVRVRTPAIGR
jgi:hypothetical protein